MTNNKSILNFKFQIFKLFLLFLLFFWSSSINNVLAADFKADYQVEYDLSEFNETLTSKVRFNIKITNLKGDVYVNKFAISFPKSFMITNLESSDDNGQVDPKVESDENNTKVEMEFSNPNVGRDSVNNFYLNFNQSNLFQQNGKVWEVVLPVIENRQGGDYSVVVSLPATGDRKISIAKPKPSQISGNKIIWNNPAGKTIYAVFGENQIYKAELVYHLKNTEVVPVITEMTLPPDTLYQKIYVESINPAPDNAYQDSDGNYLGKYLLKPLETKIVTFKGYIQVFPSAREEMKPIINQDLETQKNYLLTSQKYWTINSLEKISDLRSVKDIYDFTVSRLQYNYNKINSDNLRLGAEGVLTRPNQAVCMEFTDLFVAILREKGIKAREIEGYGVSFDPRLQPLSLASDVLHAWPEYYDEKTGLWIPVDPTWENTSGIDYFSSFDLNHITFAIHGKKSDYPLPAGMYKVGDSKDISIKATVEEPVEKRAIGVKSIDIVSRLFDNKKYQGKFVIKNNSNIYLYDIPVVIKGENIAIENEKTKIVSLAPYESEEIDFRYESLKNKNKGKIAVDVFGQKLTEVTIKIIPTVYLIVLSVGGGIIIISFLFVTVRHMRSRR